jgi:hypothetical protein
MTASSLYTGIIAYDQANHAADDPLSVDVGLALANNALHFADQAGQVRIAWDTVTGSELQAAAATGTTYTDILPKLPPFPLRLRPDGSTYAIRMRLGGYSTDGTSVTIRAVLGNVGSSRARINDVFGNVADFTTTSTSNAWRDESGGSGWTVLEFPAAEVRTVSREIVTRSNTREMASIALFELQVFVATAGATKARLSGLYAAEYWS